MSCLRPVRVCRSYAVQSIVLNLAVSESFQTVDLTAMTFPAEFLIDYVRVYQRKGQTNVGCNPPRFPTTDYIANHPIAYNSECMHTACSSYLSL